MKGVMIPQPWKCSRPGWMKIDQPGLVEGVGEGWNWMSFKASSNKKHSVISLIMERIMQPEDITGVGQS